MGSTAGSSLSHHVVVVVPLDDVGRRQQLLLDGGGRGRGRLSPGLEQVRHVEHLAGETEAERQAFSTVTVQIRWLTFASNNVEPFSTTSLINLNTGEL